MLPYLTMSRMNPLSKTSGGGERSFDWGVREAEGAMLPVPAFGPYGSVANSHRPQGEVAERSEVDGGEAPASGPAGESVASPSDGGKA